LVSRGFRIDEWSLAAFWDSEGIRYQRAESPLINRGILPYSEAASTGVTASISSWT